MRCTYCQKALVTDDPSSDHYATIEHVKPKSRGGTNSASNLRASCRACNTEKGNMTAAEYAEFCRVTEGIDLRYRRRIVWREYCKSKNHPPMSSPSPTE